MQTSWGQLFIGVLLWTLAMLMPILISYYQTENPVVSLFLLTTLYPTLISHLCRYGSFWISYQVLMAASAISLAVALFLIYVTQTKNQVILNVIPLTVFILALGVFSMQFNMYGSNVTSLL